MLNATTNLYDLSNVSTSENIFQFTQAVNDLSGGYLMFGILMVGAIILFVSMKEYGNKDALAVTTFIIGIMSISFLVLGFITIGFLVFILICFVLLWIGMLFKPSAF